MNIEQKKNYLKTLTKRAKNIVNLKNLKYKYLGAETRLTADPMSQPISDLKLSEDDFPDKAKPKGKEDKEKVLNVEGEKVSVKK